MSNAKHEMLKKVIFITVVCVILILAGCVGPRGWPGISAGEDTLYVGTMDGRVLALNPESGIRFWQWKREVKEEVGLEIEHVEYVTSLATVHEDGSPSLVISCVADYVSGEVHLQEGETVDCLGGY